MLGPFISEEIVCMERSAICCNIFLIAKLVLKITFGIGYMMTSITIF